MKNLLLLTLSLIALNSYSQSVDEIIENYYENTGGIDKWKELKGVKMLAKLNQQGMEIPIELIQMKGGKSMQIINFQGQSIKVYHI